MRLLSGFAVRLFPQSVYRQIQSVDALGTCDPSGWRSLPSDVNFEFKSSHIWWIACPNWLRIICQTLITLMLHPDFWWARSGRSDRIRSNLDYCSIQWCVPITGAANAPLHMQNVDLVYKRSGCCSVLACHEQYKQVLQFWAWWGSAAFAVSTGPLVIAPKNMRDLLSSLNEIHCHQLLVYEVLWYCESPVPANFLQVCPHKRIPIARTHKTAACLRSWQRFELLICASGITCITNASTVIKQASVPRKHLRHKLTMPAVTEHVRLRDESNCFCKRHQQWDSCQSATCGSIDIASTTKRR